jgi:hypothetical protein
MPPALDGARGVAARRQQLEARPTCLARRQQNAIDSPTPGGAPGEYLLGAAGTGERHNDR